MAKKQRTKMTAVEKDLINGLQGLLVDLQRGEPLEKKYTCRRVVFTLRPQAYNPKCVKETRRTLNVSQSVFAQFLGVSVKTVRAWELGKAPTQMACRFMDEIRRAPDYWRQRLRDSFQVRKTGS